MNNIEREWTAWDLANVCQELYEKTADDEVRPSSLAQYLAKCTAVMAKLKELNETAGAPWDFMEAGRYYLELIEAADIKPGRRPGHADMMEEMLRRRGR